MKRSNSLNNIEVRKFIETNESRLIFSDKDTIDDFMDDNNNDNDNDDDEKCFDVDVDVDVDDIDVDVDEKESLFTI